MTITKRVRDAAVGPGSGWRWAVAATLVLTAASQHPNSAFSRLRGLDPCGVIPDWRFFAPNPGTHDTHLSYRTLSHDGETSEWHDISFVTERRAVHAVWFPARRLSKSVFDVCTQLNGRVDQGFTKARRMPAYRLLVGHIRHRVRRSPDMGRVKGFQFAFFRTAGYDTSVEAELIFLSPYTPLETREALETSEAPQTRETGSGAMAR